MCWRQRALQADNSRFRWSLSSHQLQPGYSSQRTDDKRRTVPSNDVRRSANSRRRPFIVQRTVWLDQSEVAASGVSHVPKTHERRSAFLRMSPANSSFAIEGHEIILPFFSSWQYFYVMFNLNVALFLVFDCHEHYNTRFTLKSFSLYAQLSALAIFILYSILLSLFPISKSHI